MKKILVPIDGSLSSNKALEKAKEIAKAFDSKVVLVNVIAVFPSAHPYPLSEGLQLSLLMESRANSRRILEKAKDYFSDMEDKVETLLLEGTVAEEIINYANNDENKIDLVIMGSKGMGGLQNIMIGSVTRKVAIQVEKPILIVK